METTPCIVCKAQVPIMDGPISDHTYMPQSPGCWKLYCEILAREYGIWMYPEIHRLTVDAYAAQHPTFVPNQKSAQSVTVHLIGIYLALFKKMKPDDINKWINRFLHLREEPFEWLTPPPDLGAITVADVAMATNMEDHVKIVNKWARSVWKAWTPYHKDIIKLTKTL